MDLKLVNMTPFYTKVEGETLKMVFAHQYIQINKDGETFSFVPIEDKEIIFNFRYRHIKNIDDVFVFRRGNRFIRLPLYKLTTLCEGFEESVIKIAESYEMKKVNNINPETELLIRELEQMNIKHEIDRYLALRDFETCRKLVMLCNNSTSMASQ